MKQQIKHEPSFSMLQLELEPGETLVSESGSMVARSSDMQMEVKLNSSKKAGFFGKLFAVMIAFARRIVGGESFFVNHYSAAKGGTVWLSPTLSGSIRHMSMNGQRVLFSAGAYLASMGDIDLTMRWGGLRAILSREGAFFVEVSGTGDLWFNSYGAIQEVKCDGKYIVDNGHLVAFDAGLQMNIRSAGGGFMGFAASGEGLVCEFSGQGRIWLQTRNTSALVAWLTPMLPG